MHEQGRHQTIPLITPRWHPPDNDQIKLNVDGSFLFNTNYTAYGGVLRDKNDCWKGGFSSFNEHGDIVRAELMGLFKRLEIA